MSNTEITREEIHDAVRRLKFWIAFCLCELVILLIVGVACYESRGGHVQNDVIRSTLMWFPGPSRLITFLEMHGKNDVALAAELAISLQMLIHYAFFATIVTFAIRQRLRMKILDNNFFFLFLIVMCIYAGLMPLLGPTHPMSGSNRITNLSFESLSTGYTEYALLLSASDALLMLILWFHGELRPGS